MAAKIRRDDEVVVLAGKDKGRRGKVVQVRPDNRVLVSGVNLIKKHMKPNPTLGKQGGIVEKEAPLHISNVAIFNPETNKAERVGFRLNEDGTKVRVFKSNGKEVGV
ncbi:MAG: 50S ribosomal protein L24 [Gammaproteobacteria bacterium]|nr:50S ribosomal protein L24 [Gammaproteobacteria bacterium]